MQQYLTLISATPSPYARKVRILLQELAIPFTLHTEVPWDSTNSTKLHNPLEKLPVLIISTDKAFTPDAADTSSVVTTVYESSYILEYILAKMPGNGIKFLSDDVDEKLFALKVQVLADGVMDAVVLIFFERQREAPSAEWQARQMRKVVGGFKALADWAGGEGAEDGGKQKEFLVGGKFGLADIAAGALLGYVDVRFKEFAWRGKYPGLEKYFEGLNQRQSFKDTMPVPQTIKDKIV